MLARLAAQIGVVTKARSNRMPSPASRSMFGVRMIGLPAQPQRVETLIVGQDEKEIRRAAGPVLVAHPGPIARALSPAAVAPRNSRRVSLGAIGVREPVRFGSMGTARFAMGSQGWIEASRGMKTRTGPNRPDLINGGISA